MKKILGYTAAFLAGSLLTGTAAFAASDVIQGKKTATITINGASIKAPAYVINNSTYVQLYAIQQGFRHNGYQADWNGTTLKITPQSSASKPANPPSNTSSSYSDDTYLKVISLPPKNVDFTKPPYMDPWGPDHDSHGTPNSFYYRSYYSITQGIPPQEEVNAAQETFTYMRTHYPTVTIGKYTLHLHWVGVGDWCGTQYPQDEGYTIYAKVDDADWDTLTKIYQTYPEKDINKVWMELGNEAFSVSKQHGVKQMMLDLHYTGLLKSDPRPYLDPNTTSEGNQYHKLSNGTWRMNVTVMWYLTSIYDNPRVSTIDMNSHN